MKFLLCIVSWLLLSPCLAQTVLQGYLFDQNANALHNISITVSSPGQNNILGYAITNQQGAYNISIQSDIDSLQINIRSLQHQPVKEVIPNQNFSRDFYLNSESIELKEIVAKASPINQKGDTLNYSVNAFAKEQDRTIADVIKHMPGIEVLDNGKILYQGKPINKYYIENLDLLEGKYNLANENLPYKEVEKVQILQNHQPIKMLDSLVFSENAALNIKLKKQYTVTGQADIGVGTPEILWDANVTPMVFSKKKQALFSGQTNNAGKLMSRQLETLTIEDLLSKVNSIQKYSWLGLISPSQPNIAENRWVDNNSNLLSANALYKLKNDTEYKLNISFLNDFQTLESQTNTTFFLPNQTLELLEKNSQTRQLNQYKIDFLTEKNTKKHFFKNKLSVLGEIISNKGLINDGSKSIPQKLNDDYFKIENTFKRIFPIGKQLFTLDSYLGYAQNPKALQMIPSVSNPFFLPGDSILVQQNISHTAWQAHHRLKFNKKIKYWTLSPEVSLDYLQQKLNSDIEKNGTLSFAEDYTNRLQRNDLNFITKLQALYQKKYWRINISLPIRFNHAKFLNPNNAALFKDKNSWLLEPNFAINYEPNAFWKFRLSGGIENEISDINSSYNGYILSNYRNLQTMNVPIFINNTKNWSSGIYYKNPIKAFFAHINYSNNYLKRDIIFSRILDENGGTSLQAIEKENHASSHTISGKVSKYFNAIDLNITSFGSVQINNQQQLLNNQFSLVKLHQWQAGIKSEKDIREWLNIAYKMSFIHTQNTIKNNRFDFKQWNHNLSTYLYPKDNHTSSIHLNLFQNHLNQQKNQSFFIDLAHTYTWEKRKVDFSIKVNNLLNVKEYIYLNSNDYQRTSSLYQLRGRQLMLSTIFSF